MKESSLSIKKRMKLLRWMFTANRKWQRRSLFMRNAQILQFWEAVSYMGRKLSRPYQNLFRFRCAFVILWKNFCWFCCTFVKLADALCSSSWEWEINCMRLLIRSKFSNLSKRAQKWKLRKCQWWHLISKKIAICLFWLFRWTFMVSRHLTNNLLSIDAVDW